jgi:hypothetical protein
MLLTIAATKRPAVYHKIRQGALARCQENQLYGLVSFLVGPDPFAGDEEPVFMGKSAVFAPLDFTPRFTGVMTELGSAQAEGVITAEWDYPALRELWSATETPLRREMPLEQVGLLAQVYGRALTLDASQQLPPVAEDAVTEADAPLLAAEEMTLPQDENPEDASQDESGEENVLSLVTPILPTEPPIILSETPIDADDAAPVEEVEAVEPPPAPIEDESITPSAEEEITSEA